MASTTTQWILELVDKITGPMRTATESAQRMTETVDNTTESVEELGKKAQQSGGMLEKFGKGMFFMNEIKEGVDQVTDSFMNAIQPGIDFQYSMAQVEAISGITGEQLQLVSDKGRQLAKDFGVNASEGTRIFSVVLSKLGPYLAEFPDALDSIARNALTLSKTMDGDVNGAAMALTTSFNAFVTETMDAESASALINEQMNIIAKSAQVGAAEVTDLVSSLENVGPGAKNAGVSFAETAAAIQVLAQRGVYASEAGNALRDMFAILAKPTPGAIKELQAAGVNIDMLSDKTLSFSQRMQALSPIIGNDQALIELFGRENIRAGQIFLENAGKIEQWTEEVQGSNSATEQAGIIMDTTAEKLKRTQAWVDDLKISFFNLVEPLAPLMKIFGMVSSGIVTLGMTIFSFTQITSLAWGAAWAKMVTVVSVAAKAITAAIASIPIIGWIAIIVSALIGLGVYLYNTSAKVRGFFWGIWEVIKAFVSGAGKTFMALLKLIGMVLNPSNWFRKGVIQSEFKAFADTVTDIGKNIGSAYQKGMEAGMADYEKKNPKAEKEKKTELQSLNQKTEIQTGKNTEIIPGVNTGNNQKSLGLGGSGGGGGAKNITMNVTMNNTFTVNGETDYNKISQRFKQELIAIMTDVSPAIS